MGAELRHTLERLIDELARVLHDAGEARELVRRAGFRPADIPVFDTTAGVFWSCVVRAADDGKTLGGVEAIVEQAKLKFPGNRFFASYMSATVVAVPAQGSPEELSSPPNAEIRRSEPKCRFRPT